MINFEDLVFDESGYADIPQSFIPNTTMKAKRQENENAIRSFWITPINGYVLHDKNYDEEVIDPITLMPTGEIKLGYRPSTASVSANYDFSTTQVTAVNGQTVTAYGSREFYAILESEVPTDNIYGGGNNHEVMSESAENENI